MGSSRTQADTPLVADRRYRARPESTTRRQDDDRQDHGAAETGGQDVPPQASARRRRRGPIGWIAALVGCVFRMPVSHRRGGRRRRGADPRRSWSGTTQSTLPPVESLLDGRARGSVTLLDRDGRVFAWRGDQFGGVVTADTVSPHLQERRRRDRGPALLPAFRHRSPRGIACAIRINLREGRGPLSGTAAPPSRSRPPSCSASACPTTPTTGRASATTRPTAAARRFGARSRKPSTRWRWRPSTPRTRS